MPEQFANVFVSIPSQFDPPRWVDLFREIAAPAGLRYRFCFRQDLGDDWPRIQQMILASDVVIADFSATPDSGSSPDPDVLTEATFARLGKKPKPVMSLHSQSALALPFNWRQLLKIGGARAVHIPDGYEPAIREIGGWLGQLCTQPPPPPPPPRKYKGSWDVCISQSFQRGDGSPGPAGFDFANFYQGLRHAGDHLQGGPKVRLALFPKDDDQVAVWHRVQAGISRCAILVAEMSADGRSGQAPNPDVIIEASLAAFQYDVPIVPVIQSDCRLPRHWQALDAVIYDRDDLPGLAGVLADRLQLALPEAAQTRQVEPRAMEPIGGTKLFGLQESTAPAAPSLGVPRRDTSVIMRSNPQTHPAHHIQSVKAPLTAAAAAGPFERFRHALDVGDWQAAADYYNEAVSLDPWQHALFNPDRFAVEEVLGSGAFGVVFRAKVAPDEDDPREQQVVIKALLHPERLFGDPDQLFANMDLLRQAPRQGLVPIHDWDRYPRGEPNAWWHFWSPYNPDAVSLRTLIARRGTLSEQDVCGIGAGIVGGLMSAHLFNLPHLGLRPSNVLVQQDGNKWRVGLRDFGFQPDYELPVTEEPWLAALLEWASPEQKGELPITPGLQSDVYGLGLLMLYMLFGQPEINYDTLERINEIGNETLRSALEGCLRYDPRARWAQLDPILEMLKPGATHTGVGKTTSVNMPTVPGADENGSEQLSSSTDLDLFGGIEVPEEMVEPAFAEEPEQVDLTDEPAPVTLLRGATREEGPLRPLDSLIGIDKAPGELISETPVPAREKPRPTWKPGGPRQLICGIDLGTCNSVLAYVDEMGDIKVVHHTQDSIITPSAVYFPEPFKAEVGVDAKRMSLFEPLNTAQYMKLSMGDSRRSRVFHGSKFTPEMLSAIVLRRLVEHAVDELGGRDEVEINDVVITVPSSWDDVRRESTRLAARLAGLNPAAILSEPVAVALETALKQLRDGNTVFVYDFGGGTFDVTIFKLDDKTVRLMGNMGLPTLGGKDLDQKLYDHVRMMFREEFADQNPPDPDDQPASRWELLSRCEDVKVALCKKAPPQKITVASGGCTGKYTISLEDLERLIVPEIEMTKNFVLGALLEAGIKSEDIDYVLSVGGSSQIPMVQRMLGEIFGDEKMVGRSVNPQETVARGACRNAADIWCEAVRRGDLPDDSLPQNLMEKLGDAPVLREETPQALSVIVLDADGETQMVEVVIPQGTPWPARGQITAETAEDHQMNVICRLRSGSSLDPDGTERLSTISFPLVPGIPKGCPLKIELWYDGPDRLFIALWDGASGQVQQLKVPWPGPTPRQTTSWEEIVNEVEIIID